MAGIKPIKIYQYNKEGKFIKEWESISEVTRKYFSKDNTYSYPFFTRKNNEYHQMPDETYICKERLGRARLLQLIMINENKYCNLYETKTSKKAIEVFNMRGEKIAEFKNQQIACLLLNVLQTTLNRDLSHGKNKKLKDLTFKYKK